MAFGTYKHTLASARLCPHEFMIVYFQATCPRYSLRVRVGIVGSAGFCSQIHFRLNPGPFLGAVSVEQCFPRIPNFGHSVLTQETFKVAQADDLVPRSFEIPCRFVFLNAGFRSCYCRRRRRHRRCCVGVDNVVVLTVKPLNHIVPWTSLWPRSCWGRDKRPWPPTWTKCGSSSRRHRCLGPDSPIRCGYVAKKTWGWWHPTGIIFIYNIYIYIHMYINYIYVYVYVCIHIYIYVFNFQMKNSYTHF